MRNAFLLLMGLVITGSAMAQEEDNIWEKPENKAVVVVTDDVENSHSRMGTLKVSAGPAWITSKMYTSEDSYIRYEPGFECAVSYEHVGSKGWGLSIDMNYNRTSYELLYSKSTFHLLHIGPGVVYAGVDEHWRYSIELGIGVTYCEEKVDSDYGTYIFSGNNQVGLGFNSRIGAEYMLTEKFGIGVDLNGALMLMKNKMGYNPKDLKIYGISHCAVLIGPRFYF